MNDNLIKVWQDTEDYCDTVIKNETEMSTKNSTVIINDEEVSDDAQAYLSTTVTVTSRDTITAAYSQPEDANVCILNFASATNPGGGTTKGSMAQEECICRCTNLLPCLYDSDAVWNQFYQYHRSRKDNRYSHRCIYTPDVILFKNCDYDYVRSRKINVISCAAPNLRANPNNEYNPGNGAPIIMDDLQQYELHYDRGERILKCAINRKCTHIILGAFGCGAFCNNPRMVAQAYNDLLKEYKHYFKYIEFAVYCGKDKTNYDVFSSVIECGKH